MQSYCHSHQLSRLCTTCPSIPFATHLHPLVNHTHLESIRGSSSPVTANQAPHKSMLTPHCHVLVSQLCCMSYLSHLSVYSSLSSDGEVKRSPSFLKRFMLWPSCGHINEQHSPKCCDSLQLLVSHLVLQLIPCFNFLYKHNGHCQSHSFVSVYCH